VPSRTFTSPAGISRPSYALERERSRRVLLDLLAELAEKVDVRVLLWAGAPLPLFSRRVQLSVRSQGGLRAVGVQVALDAKERPLHCHHEKLVVVDNRLPAWAAST